MLKWETQYHLQKYYRKSVTNETKDWSSLMKKCLKEEVSVNSVFCLVSEGSHTSEGRKVWWLGTQGLDRSSMSVYDVKGNRKQSLPTAPSRQISKLQHLGRQDSSFFVRLYLLCSQTCRVIYKSFAELGCRVFRIKLLGCTGYLTEVIVLDEWSKFKLTGNGKSKITSIVSMQIYQWN